MSDTQNNETRDENGRFRPGASGNPHGRPPKAREQAYLDTLKERLGLEAWAKIVDKAIKDAQGGDDKARASVFVVFGAGEAIKILEKETAR